MPAASRVSGLRGSRAVSVDTKLAGCLLDSPSSGAASRAKLATQFNQVCRMNSDDGDPTLAVVCFGLFVLAGLYLFARIVTG
jgi:hypothetical protein